MNYRPAALILLLGLAIAAHAQGSGDSSRQKPKSAPAGAKSGARPVGGSAGEPFVIEHYATRVRYEESGAGEKVLTAAIRIQSDAGVQQFQELIFGYNSAIERLDVHFVRIRHGGGAIVNVGADAIRDEAAIVDGAAWYGDMKETHIALASLQSGDTLEYEIATHLLPPSPGNFWFETSFLKNAVVLDERVELNVPMGRPVNVKSPLFHYVLTHDAKNQRSIYRWTNAHLKLPENQDAANQAQAANAEPPDIQATTFTNWRDISMLFAHLAETHSPPPPEIRAKVSELIADRPNEIDKIAALYAYVSKAIRYVAIPADLDSLQPHSPLQVLTNQYGDSNDKATLLAAMLDAAHLHADIFRIPSARAFDESFPSPLPLDHAILSVKHENSQIWLDSAPQVAPFGYLPPPLRGKSALLLAPDGGNFVKTPADPPFPSVQDVQIDGHVSSLGKLTARVHYSARGDSEFLLRLAFHRTPSAQWKELAQTILNFDGIHGEVSSVEPSDPTETEQPFRLAIEFTQLNFLDWLSSSERIAIPLSSMGLPDPPEDAAKPVELGTPLAVTTKIQLDLPATWTAQAPVATEVSRDYATFKSSYRFGDHTLTAERSLQFKMREVPPARASDYLAFTRAVRADENQKLLVANPTAGAASLAASEKSADLLEAGAAALQSGNARSALPLFQRVVELEPQHQQAWDDLGLAYLRLGNLEDAARAFRKQIEVNPATEHSHDYLGLTLQQQLKLDDAVDAFRQQMKVNPLDTVALAGLGSTLMDQHRFSDAIPELEKAVILSPKNIQLQLNLGDTYLNVGQNEKALSAFDKAVERSPSPAVWNRVALHLADHGIELDKARQYAEKAVSASSARLSTLDFSRQKNSDLGDVDLLGICWDTLGWVHFQKGDLDSAERFIRAAWTLDERGPAAEHWGRILEKRGAKQQAIHMYALALAARDPDEEARARLTLLLGGNEKIDGLVTEAAPELAKIRSIAAGELLAEDAQADFLIRVSPHAGKSAADAVTFLGGSEKLREFASRLRVLDYGPMFPDATPLEITRRGTLACSAARGECVLILAVPGVAATTN